MLFNRKKPSSAQVVEAMRILTFPKSMSVGSVKAKLSTKIAIVKPIPPKIPAPNSFLKLIFDYKLAMPNLTANKLAKTIPSGLPTTRPKKMPKLAGFEMSVEVSSGISMAVLASANKGKIT